MMQALVFTVTGEDIGVAILCALIPLTILALYWTFPGKGKDRR